MTVDYGWQEETPFDQDQADGIALGWSKEKPVHVAFTESQKVASEFTSWATFPVPVVGQYPVQLCPHRYHRMKSRFRVNIPQAPSGTLQDGTSGLQAPAAVVPATAGSVSLLAPVPSAPYITVATGFSFGLATTDAKIITLDLTGVHGTPDWYLPAGQQQLNVTFPVPVLNFPAQVPILNWTATATAAGEAVLYGEVQVSNLVPVLYVANKPDILTSGALQNAYALYNNQPLPDYEGQEPLYAVAAMTGVTIAVKDESYGAVQ